MTSHTFQNGQHRTAAPAARSSKTPPARDTPASAGLQANKSRLSVQELAYQLEELRGRAQSIAQESCADLLRVSAGLGAVLRLLDFDSDDVEDSHGLHCLLTPLKQQLDEALNRVQGML